MNLPFNTLQPRQNGRHFADDTFKSIFLSENLWISLNISLKFLPKVWINNIPALVQIMVCCDLFVIFLTHKQLETHGCVLSTVPTDALVLKAPGYQYPQCWLNIHCIGPVSYRNITGIGNNTNKLTFIGSVPLWARGPQHLGWGAELTHTATGEW